VDKFAKRYLVWQAICKCDLKSSVFVYSGTINQNVYVEECLQKRLLPMLRPHKASVLFWPDLATCHYGKLTMEWYKENGVNIVPKNANPPNCPEIRPIKKYWAIMKRKLLLTKESVKNKKDFQRKWIQMSSEVTQSDVQHLMERVNSKLRLFAYTSTK